MSNALAIARRYAFPLWPSKTLMTVLSVLVAVVLPIVCFVATAEEVPNSPDWQSGEFHAYMSFLLKAEVSWVFFPFLIYAVLCLVFFLFFPKVASRYTLVRFGIYSGVPLSLQFVWILGVVLFRVTDDWIALAAASLGIAILTLVQLAVPIFAWFLLVGAKILLKQIVALIPRRLLIVGCGFLVVVLGILVALDLSTNQYVIARLAVLILLIALFVPSFSAPAWSIGVYAYHSSRVIRMHDGHFQIRLWQFLLAFTWIAAYLGAWRTAMTLMLDAYAKLPVNPPERCYIATAAARGTPRFVRSWEIVRSDGSLGRVNRQLAYLKLGELALLALAPRFHVALRWLYDRCAPPLARRMARPWLANLAYCALKPLEWTVRLALAVLLGDVDKQVDKLYGAGFTSPLGR